MNDRAWIGGLTCLLFAAAFARAAEPEARAPTLAADAALLEVIGLPPEAKIALDGKEQGTRRRFDFSGLKPTEYAAHKVEVELPEGSVTHTVVLRGGWHVRLPVELPSSRRVRPVLQVGHTQEITASAFSPDGKYLVTTSVDRSAIIWDVATGRKLREFEVPAVMVGCVAFSPDGKEVAFGMGTTGVSMKETMRELGGAGAALMSMMGNEGVAVFETRTGRKVQILESKTGGVSGVYFSADGKQLIMASGYLKRPRNDGDEVRAYAEVTVWDRTTGRPVRTLPIDGGGMFGQVAFSPDRKRLLTTPSFLEQGGAACGLWNLETGKKLRSFEAEGGKNVVAYSPDGKQVLTFGANQTLFLWDAETGGKIRSHSLGREDKYEYISRVVFNPDGRSVAIAMMGTVLVLDLASGKELASLPSAMAFAAQGPLNFSPDGKLLITGGSKGDVEFWDWKNKRHLRNLRGRSGEAHGRVAVAPDGSTLAVGSRGKVTLWDLRTGKKTGSLDTSQTIERSMTLTDGKEQKLPKEKHETPIEKLVFSPDSRRLLTIASGEEGAVLWDVRTGRELRRLQPEVRGRSQEGGIRALDLARRAAQGDGEPGEGERGLDSMAVNGAFSPDGKVLLIVHRNGGAVLWGTTGTCTQKWTVEKEGAFGSPLRFHPDGRSVLTACEDGRIRRWDIEEGKLLRTYPGRFAHVPKDDEPITFARLTAKMAIMTGGVVLSPDGKSLLCSSYVEEEVVVWDIEAGERNRALKVKDGLLPGLVFSSSGNYVYARTPRFIKILNWRTGAEVSSIAGTQSLLPASLEATPDDRYLFSASAEGSVVLFDLATGRQLAELLNDGDDWLVATPQGLFDGSASGQQLVCYKLDDGLTVVPVDRFYQDFHTSGLLARLLAGERPRPTQEIGVNKAPLVRLVAPPPDGPASARTVTLDVEVVDQGGGTQPPWLTHNCNRQLLPGRPEQNENGLKRRFVVDLVPGDNVLMVRSASDDGSWESEPAMVVLTYGQKVPLPELYVLVVGVSKYADASLNLDFAALDADAVGKLFERRGKPLYNEVYVTRLLDEKATRAGIRDALRAIAAKAQKQDTVLVFLAGHGMVIDNDQYHFLPSDFRQSAANLADDVRKQGVSWASLGQWLAAVPSLKRLLVFDSCNSGAVVGRVGAGRNPFALREATERLARAQGIFTIAAAAVGQEAKEVRQLGHGVLTYCLLAGLNAVADGPLQGLPIRPEQRRDTADVLEWFGYAQTHVPTLTKRYFDREQDVQFNLSGDSFPVLPLKEQQQPDKGREP